MGQERRKKSSIHIIVAAVLGACTFVVTVFFLQMGLLGILLSIGASVAVALIFAPASNRYPVLSGVDGITQEQYEETLKNAERKLALIQGHIRNIQKTSVQQKAAVLADTIGRIIQNVKDDPKDIRPARKFFDYYMDTTIKLLDGYVDIEKRNVSDPQLKGALLSIEQMLEKMNKAFEKQLVQLLEDNLLDLETELKVLHNTIDLEGLGEDNG